METYIVTSEPSDGDYYSGHYSNDQTQLGPDQDQTCATKVAEEEQQQQQVICKMEYIMFAS